MADEKFGEILGVHIIGPEAFELISEAVTAMEAEATVETMMHTIHAHPTMYEAMGEAFQQRVRAGDQCVMLRHHCVHTSAERGTHECVRRDLGRIGYAEAFALQKDLVEQRKRGAIPDQLLIVEHPHVITLGRNGHMENLLASEEVLRARRHRVSFAPIAAATSPITGPGQIVGYPIFDLREWKRDVVAYVRALEQVDHGLAGGVRHRSRTRSRAAPGSG